MEKERTSEISGKDDDRRRRMRGERQTAGLSVEIEKLCLRLIIDPRKLLLL